jgi:hypothetical protein
MICDCCRINIDDYQTQYIQVIENHGPHEDEDEYFFCSVKCVLGWYE